jgi:hypothetical protein
MAITFIAATANILQMGVVTNIFKSIALLPPTLSFLGPVCYNLLNKHKGEKV